MMNRRSTGYVLGQWKHFVWYSTDGWMPLYIHSNPQNIQYQKWTLIEIMDLRLLWCVNAGLGTMKNVPLFWGMFTIWLQKRLRNVIPTTCPRVEKD